MRLETKIELAILLVGAVAVGGWVGLRVARKPGKAGSKAPVANTRGGDAEEVRPPQRIMKAPPLEKPAPKVPVEEKKPGPVRPLPARIDPKTALVHETAKPAKTKTQTEPKTHAEKIVERIDEASRPAMDKALSLLNSGNKFEARAVLTRLILNTPEGAARERTKETLDKLNRELFFSPAPSRDAKYHTVERGDSLAVIAKRFEKDYYFHQLIMKINNISDARRIRAGQKLKVPVGRFAARIEKSKHRLIVFMNEHYIKEYAVGIGAPASPTPAGAFIVANNKQINPAWSAPNGRIYKYGDPNNILGTRWIGFKKTADHRGYGIHGTTDDTSIGGNVSNGCIRMLKTDVEEVFTMLMPGDIVEIVE